MQVASSQPVCFPDRVSISDLNRIGHHARGGALFPCCGGLSMKLNSASFSTRCQVTLRAAVLSGRAERGDSGSDNDERKSDAEDLHETPFLVGVTSGERAEARAGRP